ncbi:hypothetical protein [Microbacterium hydrocarbonoxydans]|nr:hypothetical protein [Microbacterium hydrocarbonoxydans]
MAEKQREHTLTVWNGIDVPDEVSSEIMRLLSHHSAGRGDG